MIRPMAVDPRSRQIKIYDTTLRDGTQGEGVAFSMEDKVRIAQRLDQLGVHYIEGGWPGQQSQGPALLQARAGRGVQVARRSPPSAPRGGPACGRRRTRNIQALVEAGPPVVTIFGKAWDFHVTAALGTTLDENLAMIARLRRLPPEALRGGHLRRRALLRRLQEATRTTRCRRCSRRRPRAPHCLVLCDTNGGSLPHEIAEIVREVKRAVKAETPLGIHVHNDTECAVANSLAAVGEGDRPRAGDDQRLRRALRQRQPRSRSSPTSC